MKAYKTTLHQFVEEFYRIKDAKLDIIDENYFNVSFSDGRILRYTYNPKIANVNKEVKLLAKGTKALNELIEEAAVKGAYSNVDIEYTKQSVAESFKEKKCCGLCQYSNLCESKDTCCDFCHYYRDCNTRIINAEFKELGIITQQTPINAICFIFKVEINNDYSLGDGLHKRIMININMDTGEVLPELIVNGLETLQMREDIEPKGISDKDYYLYYKQARDIVQEMVIPQMELFKHQMQEPLMEKIEAIIEKHYIEYLDTYTKTKPEESDEMQSQAVRLCERELQGYAVNVTFNLENVFIYKTNKDIRNLIFSFKNKEISKNVEIQVELFLHKVNISCTHCGIEIDKGYICSNEHVLCTKCSTKCEICETVLCDSCGDEGISCSTCGSLVCPECTVICEKCGIEVCNDHAYSCSVCGKKLCIDCYELCTECATVLCSEHVNNCEICEVPICEDHLYKCEVCGKGHCIEHVFKCEMCENDKGYRCQEHIVESSFSAKHFCGNHIGTCSICKRVLGKNEINLCSICSTNMCPEHSYKSSGCGKHYCKQHIIQCEACGKLYCSCTEFDECIICGQSYCEGCVNEKGICKICNALKEIKSENTILKKAKELDERLNKYTRFYFSKSDNRLVIYAHKLMEDYVVVFDINDSIIYSKRILINERLKLSVSKLLSKKEEE